MPNSKKTILVAMSGGVDSSVVAAILRNRGHKVIGVTMQIWQENQRDPRHAGCCSLGAVEDARRVARMLGIPHYVINYKDAFRKTVIQNFIDEYGAGRTPNPCVQCNRHIKFESLVRTMHELGCDQLATGHYARVRRDSRLGGYRLLRSRGGEKDQSYVLYMLAQHQLKHVIFPLGELGSKVHTRQMARDYGLPVADKPDSQEICFVSEAGGYRDFLRQANPDAFQSGEIVDTEGRTMGEHRGVAGFTVGQRKGIGLTVPSGKPLFVLRLEPSQNRVVVGYEDDLLQRVVQVEDVTWGVVGADYGSVMAKIRYNMAAVPARLEPTQQGAQIVFRNPVRAVTPGQIAVAYRGESVVAGGTIVA